MTERERWTRLPLRTKIALNDELCVLTHSILFVYKG